MTPKLLSAQEYLRLRDEGKDPFEKALTAKTGKACSSDDYFEELGRLVEAHPVGLPRKHKPTATSPYGESRTWQ